MIVIQCETSTYNIALQWQMRVLGFQMAGLPQTLLVNPKEDRHVIERCLKLIVNGDNLIDRDLVDLHHAI